MLVSRLAENSITLGPDRRLLLLLIADVPAATLLLLLLPPLLLLALLLLATAVLSLVTLRKLLLMLQTSLILLMLVMLLVKLLSLPWLLAPTAATLRREAGEMGVHAAVDFLKWQVAGSWEPHKADGFLDAVLDAVQPWVFMAGVARALSWREPEAQRSAAHTPCIASSSLLTCGCVSLRELCRRAVVQNRKQPAAEVES